MNIEVPRKKFDLSSVIAEGDIRVLLMVLVHMTGFGCPSANSFSTAARISAWISGGTPACGSGIRRTSRFGL